MNWALLSLLLISTCGASDGQQIIGVTVTAKTSYQQGASVEVSAIEASIRDAARTGAVVSCQSFDPKSLAYRLVIIDRSGGQSVDRILRLVKESKSFDLTSVETLKAKTAQDAIANFIAPNCIRTHSTAVGSVRPEIVLAVKISGKDATSAFEQIKKFEYSSGFPPIDLAKIGDVIYVSLDVEAERTFQKGKLEQYLLTSMPEARVEICDRISCSAYFEQREETTFTAPGAPNPFDN